jgi:tetratricopeptide (TPR) repeat protein
MRAKQFNVADEHWRELIELLESSDYASQSNVLEAAYYYEGIVMLETKRPERALGYLKQALRINRTASDTHYATAVAYERLGNAKAQKEALKIALTFDPAMPDAAFDMGLVVLAEGDTATAAEFFRTSADNAENKSEPLLALRKLGTSDARMRRAKALLAKGETKKALSEARIAAALAPGDNSILLFVARVYEKLKDKKMAAKVYAAILEAAPKNAAATEGLKRTKAK